MTDKILEDIRQVKQNLGRDWDYEDGYGELKNLVFTALDIADELREAVIAAHSHNKKIVYGKDVPAYYSKVIVEQLERTKNYLTYSRKDGKDTPRK